jgi:hypothetical protein
MLSVLNASSAQNAFDLYPQVVISNGLIEASIFLPDSDKGFYRGTRYEWSGMIRQLVFDGHTFFMPRHDQQPHDPTHPDHGMSLAEEFRMGSRTSFSSSAYYQSYYETKPGETFVVIGIGRLKKPDDEPYEFGGPYPVVDPGKWTVAHEERRVTFTHELSDPSGYRYRYSKVMELISGKPELVISHSLENLGTQIIHAFQYCHNFFAIDHMKIGSDYQVELPFVAEFKRETSPILSIEGKTIKLLGDLKGRWGSLVEGYGRSIAENRCLIRNTKAKAGVEITGDSPIEGFFFYADESALCPEIMVNIFLKPGERQHWRRSYRFFAGPQSGKAEARFPSK